MDEDIDTFDEDEEEIEWLPGVAPYRQLYVPITNDEGSSADDRFGFTDQEENELQELVNQFDQNREIEIQPIHHREHSYHNQGREETLEERNLREWADLNWEQDLQDKQRQLEKRQHFEKPKTEYWEPQEESSYSDLSDSSYEKFKQFQQRQGKA